jgi:hypothetical protein
VRELYAVLLVSILTHLLLTCTNIATATTAATTTTTTTAATTATLLDSLTVEIRVLRRAELLD